MDEYKTIWAILFLIAIIIPPQKIMGAKGFMNDWDSCIEKPTKRLPPPKLIQLRYNIDNAPINIITYLTFLVDYVVWVMCIIMLPCVLLFQGKSLDISFLIFAILYMAINLPVGIMRTICCLKISKKQNIKLQTEEYVVMRTLAETIFHKPSSAHREAMQKHREYVEIIEPFLKDFEKCIKKKKGIQYIPEDGIKWLTNKIFPKYKKYLMYNVSDDEPQKKLLTIYLIESNEVIIQLPIKKD